MDNVINAVGLPATNYSCVPSMQVQIQVDDRLDREKYFYIGTSLLRTRMYTPDKSPTGLGLGHVNPRSRYPLGYYPDCATGQYRRCIPISEQKSSRQGWGLVWSCSAGTACHGRTVGFGNRSGLWASTAGSQEIAAVMPFKVLTGQGAESAETLLPYAV
jgi:hypothetical protein